MCMIGAAHLMKCMKIDERHVKFTGHYQNMTDISINHISYATENSLVIEN